MRRAEIEALLPAVFQRTARAAGPLAALLDVMEVLHSDSEAVFADLDVAFDPRRADDAMVVFLAHWVDLDRFFVRAARGGGDLEGREPISSGVGRLRELVAAAAYLSQRRGTTDGLRRFLQVATGQGPFEIDEHPLGEQGEAMPFHVRITVPGEAEPHRSLVERIIEEEKPAYVTYELRFSP